MLGSSSPSPRSTSSRASSASGVTSLSLGGFARWQDYGDIWLTWWLGDAAGDLVVAPVVLLWATGPRWPPRRAQLFEAGLLIACLVFVGELVFGGLFPAEYKNYPLEFMCIPFLLWAAFRFGARGAATALVLLCGIAIRGTLEGFGPFVWGTHNESLLLLQAFMGVTAVTTLILGAVVAERSRSAAQLRLLAGVACGVERRRIAASIGVAVYPRDGGSAEALLGAADRLLYEMKAQGRRK